MANIVTSVHDSATSRTGRSWSITTFGRLLFAADPSSLEVATVFLGTVCALAAGVPFPLMGIVFGELLNEFNSATCTAAEYAQQKLQSDIDDRIKLLVYLAVAQFVLVYTHLFCWSIHGARLAQRLREQYLQALLRQEPAYFDSVSPGEIASRLDSDIQTIRSGVSDKFGITVATIGFFITCYVVAFIKDAVLAAMLLSLVPAHMIASLVGGHYVEKYAGLMSEAAAKAASVASEALSNVVVVQAFGASERLQVNFTKSLEESQRYGTKKAIAAGTQAGGFYFIAYSANALAFWYGSRQIASAVGQEAPGITVGAVFTVIFVLIEASALLSQIAPWLSMFSAAVASYNKLCADINRPTLIDSTERGPGTKLTSLQGAYELKDITFTYPSRPDTVVLDKVSLRIPALKHTAIVGLSGSGKSTIAGLLTRLYDPMHGQVLADGHDLTTVNIRSLRSFIGLVQQEPALLDRSILENIAQGLAASLRHTHLQAILLDGRLVELAQSIEVGHDLRETARRFGDDAVEVVDLVYRAARIAHAHEFITAMRHGYGTNVGSGGRMLSGGQKQRVALAMAIVKDPKVLILDEATAALDSTSEISVQRAIAQASTGRTTITIAHRLSTIASADNIAVMHKGVIVEQGSHTELMAKNGSYADMVRIQSLQAPNADTNISAKDVDVIVSELGAANDTIQTPESSIVDEKQAISSADELASDKAQDEEAELETPSKSLWTLIKGYAPALRPYAITILIAFTASIVVGGSYSGEAVIFGNTIGALSPCRTPDDIRGSGDFFGLMFFIIAIIEFFANLVSWIGFGLISERLVLRVRTLCFSSLLEQDLHWHQSKNRTPGNLLSYITRDGNALAGLSGSVIGTTFSITVNLVAAIILTHIIAWKIALVCLALVPILLAAGLMELRAHGKFEERNETAYAKSVDIGTEAIKSIKTIASYSLDEIVLETYRRALAKPKKETAPALLQTSLWRSVNLFAANLANALAYWWGAKQIIEGNYTQTQFLIVSFSLLVGALLWSNMFALAPELTNARAAMARILGLIELGSQRLSSRPVTVADPEHTTESKGAILGGGQGSTVQLKDVHFAYPARPDLPVLTGVNMDIKAGQFCAIVGPSGAGKSTIISLVERLYSVQSGSILIDGVDITKTRDTIFRDQIALVPQESVLFEGSVEFNVGLGAKPGQEVSLDDIKEACKLANIHDVIDALPDGYQTRCGPHGSQFSGGQKQRLSIARALVRKPRLLILDEPTSALDAESEQLLEAGLEKATINMTVIAIAHRLRTIRKADVIFLIDAGICVDQGTHEELFARSQSYRTNVMHQVVAE